MDPNNKGAKPELTPEFTDKYATPSASTADAADPEHRMRDDAAHPADEKLPPPTVEEQEQRLESERVTRRTFMMNVGIALNALVRWRSPPVVAYVLGPVTRRKEYLSWVDARRRCQFPAGRDDARHYINPFNTPWDGETAKIPAYVRCSDAGQVHRVCHQLRASGLPGALVLGVATVHVSLPRRRLLRRRQPRLGPPERGLFTYEMKVENGKLLINAGQMPTLSRTAPAHAPCPGRRCVSAQHLALVTRIEPCTDSRQPAIASQALVQTHLRLARAAHSTRRPDQGGRAAPVPKSTASWWYVFGSAPAWFC